MSQWNVLLTDQAEDDLRGIHEYIALTLLEPGIAVKLTRRIKLKINKLKGSPLSYALYPKEPWKSRGLRRANEKNYAIFFVPVRSKNTVVVIRIMYAGRDIEQILDETPDI